VTAPCSQHPKTCINTGFKQNCCHCFLSQYKKYPLLLSITFLSTFILSKCQKAPFYKGLIEKNKTKKVKKGRRGGLPCIYTKKTQKTLLCLSPKKLKIPIL